MTPEQLETFLLADTESELWHLEHPGVLSPAYQNIPLREYEGEKVYFFDFKNTLLSQNIAIVKESRYTTIPAHFHKDMELNYIYRGSCTFVINGQPVVMQQGDLCILDSNVRHSAVSYKNKEDIVINIVFRKAFFNTMFLSRLSSHGIVSSFLLDVISQNRAHDRHLIFHTQNNCKIHPLVQFLLCEYFSPSVCAQELIPIYVSAIFTELINTLRHSDEFRLPEKSNVLLILKYIEQNYKTCTLQSTARYFGYNSNYLGNLLKQRTGKTFRDLKLMQQLTQAALLLVNSDESVLDIIDKVGCTNCSYFYRKFAAAYRSTPLQYRQQHGNP